MGTSLLKAILSMFIASVSYAQGSSSDQLERAMSQRLDSRLGTISGQKDARKGKALEHSYTYFAKEPAVKSAPKAQKQDFSKSYIAFRKKHKVPDYVGDDAIDTALKEDDLDSKKEAVKIVETEKLLHQIYEVYHTDAAGSEKANSELSEKADVIAKQSAGILRGSIQKLSISSPREASNKKAVFLASGGRYFSSAAKQDNILAVKSHVVDQIRKDLVKAMSTAINSYFRGHQKTTALTKAQDAKQLVAFVRGAQKSISRLTPKQRIAKAKEIRAFIARWAEQMQSSGADSVKLNKADIDSLVKQMENLTVDSAAARLGDAKMTTLMDSLTKVGTSATHFTKAQTRELNQKYQKSEKGSSTASAMFRPGIDPNRLSASERKEWDSALKAWNAKNAPTQGTETNSFYKSMNSQNNEVGSLSGSQNETGFRGGSAMRTLQQQSQSSGSNSAVSRSHDTSRLPAYRDSKQTDRWTKEQYDRANADPNNPNP